MTIPEKVAYLKGLAEGLDLDTENSKEGKLISVMIGILEEVADSIVDLEDAVDDVEDELDAMEEELDAISDDLEDVEDIVYDEDDDEDEDEDDWDEDDEEEEDEDDEDFFEVECPNCGADIVIDQAVLDARQVECPSCGEAFAIDLTDEEDEGEETPEE